jgi:peptidoglycan/xylan/chitin deacetylase (PgdA/CDA1 family)
MAITFDDGPSENTDDILDVLRAANMKATFFLIGRKLKMFPDAVRRIAAEGHQIGAHTFNHVKLVNMTSEDVRKEMTMFEDALGNFGISMLKYMRPPWGVLDDVS